MMRQVRGVAAALALLLLAGCGGDPAEETPAVSGTEPPAGEITLYGEIHGNAAIKEYEAERWKECYDQGMRHLFVELPYYTAQWLNLWMDAEDDGILEQLRRDWEGTYASGAETLDFYRTVKEQCPETVFHGTDVGHQYDSTGARYRDYLEEQGLTDTEDYRLTLEAIEQGQTFYRAEDDAYRENTMAANFIREFDALGGESVMGIYGGAHIALDGMDYNSGTVPAMAAQLKERYGDALRTEDITWMGQNAEPQGTDTLTVAGRAYQASCFGEEDISGLSEDYQSRAFWRLEGAYEDFKDCPATDEVLPYNNYPMPIETGQVFVLDYTQKDGTVTRFYYRSDGEVWNGMDCTTEFIPE